MRQKTKLTAQSLMNEIQNTMDLLYKSKFIYYYNTIKLSSNSKYVELSCINHNPGRANCGKAFTTFEQYETILYNNNFCCILYDGSLVKLEMCFDHQELISHSYLWWPAPYRISTAFMEEQTPRDVYEDFKADSFWFKRINMRSPIRVDFDRQKDEKGHPAVHLHTQHHDSRMKVNRPICFNRFMRFIIENYYPDTIIDFDKWHYELFEFDAQNNDINRHTCLELS